MVRLPLWAVPASLLAAAPVPAPAVEGALAPPGAPAVEGAVAPPGAAACSGCHAPAGGPATAMPSLAGLSPAAIEGAMRAYRAGERSPTIMNRIARGFTDEEIRAMAAWLGAPG